MPLCKSEAAGKGQNLGTRVSGLVPAAGQTLPDTPFFIIIFSSVRYEIRALFRCYQWTVSYLAFQSCHPWFVGVNPAILTRACSCFRQLCPAGPLTAAPAALLWAGVYHQPEGSPSLLLILVYNKSHPLYDFKLEAVPGWGLHCPAASPWC